MDLPAGYGMGTRSQRDYCHVMLIMVWLAILQVEPAGGIGRQVQQNDSEAALLTSLAEPVPMKTDYMMYQMAMMFSKVICMG